MNDQRKKLAGLAACCLALSVAASAQTRNPQTPAEGRQNGPSEVAAHQEALAQAAAVFLDTSRSLEERAAAAQRVDLFLRPDQIAAAVRVARNPSEAPRLRALALARIPQAVAKDDALFTDLLRWVASPETPAELHRAAVDVADALAFSSLAAHARRGELLDAFRALTRDPEPDLRRRAFARLSAEGDDFAQRQLLEGLKSPSRAPLPAADAVNLLGLRLPADAYPVLRELLFHPPDEATRLEVIRHLGGHPPSRPDLIRILQNPEESAQARQAALGALHANVPESLPEIVLPVLQDDRAADELRVFAIQAVRWRRASRSLQLQGIAAFDAAVRDLARGARSEAVRRAAAEYLQATGAPAEPRS